jgi:predicted ATPase/class 3 adenylate cyclase
MIADFAGTRAKNAAAGPLGTFRHADSTGDDTPLVARTLPDSPHEVALARLQDDSRWSLLLGPQVALQPERLVAGDGEPRLLLLRRGLQPLRGSIGSPLPVDATLRLGLALTRILASMHAKGFVHGSLSPDVVWVTEDFAEARVTALDLAFTDAGSESRSPRTLYAQDLRYLAPELSTPGRPADRRADLYALGVLLYEAASGQVPFGGSDAVGIHHAHSAVESAPLVSRTPGIPESLSLLVATLLAKDPAERYQSATGVRRDLEAILAHSQRTGMDALPGRFVRDGPQRPDSLFGRQAESVSLAAMLGRPRAGSFGLVAGPSGSGKSALVDHAIRDAAAHGIVGAGKCDQLQHQQPFAALRQPLESVLRWIDAADEATRSAFRQAAVPRLSGTAGALRAILPVLGRLVPCEGSAPAPSGHAGEARIRAAFHDLLATLGSLPLNVSVVIDDLQWADAASIAILSSIASSPSPPPVVILCTFRSDEITDGSELATTIATMRAHPSIAADVELGALSEADVLDLVASSLGASREEVAPLAANVWSHSQGNVMFVVEELQELWRRGFLFREPVAGTWFWSESDLLAVARSSKLSELMTARVGRLDPETRRLLGHAACFGRSFETHALEQLLESPPGEVPPLLLAATREGLLLADGDGPGLAGWRFTHDQVQSATYGILEQPERESIHLKIAERLLGGDDGDEERVPGAISHLNAAERLLRDQGRSRWLARCNLLAARSFLASAAFADAHVCLRTAIDLLDDATWQEDRDLAWDVHVEAARTACLASAAPRALELVAALRGRSRSESDEVLALEIAIDAFKVLDRFDDAIAAGREALDKLGVHLPRRPSTTTCLARLLRTHLKVMQRGANSLTGLPPMRDARASAAMRILADLGSPSFLVMPALFLAIVDAQLRLSLRSGNAPESPYAYALYAIMVAGPFGQIARGHELGRAALKVAEGTDPSQLPRTRMAAFVFVMPWKTPLPECLEAYVDGSRRAMEVGDPESANYLACGYAAFSFHAGPTLAEACAQLDTMRERVLSLGQQRQYAADIYHQTMRNLRSADADPVRLAGPLYDEDRNAPGHADAPEMNGHVHLCSLILALLFDRPEDHAKRIRGFRATLPKFDGMYVRAAFFFYEAVALMRFDGGRKARLLARAALARMRRWAKHCPSTFDHKVLFLEAEFARAAGDHRRAAATFAESAALAERAGFHMEAGLALEAAHACARTTGLTSLARHFLAEARRVYEAWGAEAKVRELDIRFGSGASPAAATTSGARSARDWDLAPAALDLVALLEASQALSEGMELDATIRRIMHTIAAIAGAQRGVLLAKADTGWSILATADTRGDVLEVEVFPDGRTIDENDKVSWFAARVVEEVDANGEALILSDPDSDPVFRADPHMQRRRPRSLLCCPIQHGNERRAFVYLEHQLRRDAFSVRQLESVRLLSTQAAISLDNARLYARQMRLSAGAHRFVPSEFLRILGKTDVDQVALSDHVEAEMTILVCDIRGFSSTTETMTPEESFAYINEFFALAGPAVRKHGGFIMKYMGDGFMAVFPRSADDAAETALAIPRLVAPLPRLRVGIGLHSGAVAIGAVGERSRLQGDVMSDVANVACRLESLTREHAATTILSVQTQRVLSPALRDRTRPLGAVPVKGRIGAVEIFTLE